MLELSVKKTACAILKGRATECFDVVRRLMAGTMVLAKPACCCVAGCLLEMRDTRCHQR